MPESRVEWLRRWVEEHTEVLEKHPKVRLTFHFGAGPPTPEVTFWEAPEAKRDGRLTA